MGALSLSCWLVSEVKGPVQTAKSTLYLACSPSIYLSVCPLERWWESKVPWLWWSALNHSVSQSDGTVGPLGEDHRERSLSAGMLLELFDSFVCVHLVLVNVSCATVNTINDWSVLILQYKRQMWMFYIYISCSVEDYI